MPLQVGIISKAINFLTVIGLLMQEFLSIDQHERRATYEPQCVAEKRPNDEATRRM